MEQSINEIFDIAKLKDNEVCMLNPLQLAYIGDTVYEVCVRNYIISKCKKNVNEMHKLSVKFVKASAQSKILEAVELILNDEEKNIVRRGRNTKTTHVPKNSEMIDYRRATALEALIGYLYLMRRYERVSEIMKIAFESVTI